MQGPTSSLAAPLDDASSRSMAMVHGPLFRQYYYGTVPKPVILTCSSANTSYHWDDLKSYFTTDSSLE